LLAAIKIQININVIIFNLIVELDEDELSDEEEHDDEE